MNILVIGDACEDVFIYGNCVRLSPDAPVPIFNPTSTIRNGGMAKNVYENVKAFGVNVRLITNKNEIIKTRYVHKKTNQMLLRIDVGELDGEVDRIQNLDVIDYDYYDVIIISDYNKGFLYDEDIKYICEHHKFVIIDTKRPIDLYCKSAKFIKLNEHEYEASKKRIGEIDLFNSLIVTLGEKGCRYKNKIYSVEEVDIKDQTGAGDTFVTAFVIKYLLTNDIDEAITYANKCASYTVQKKGVVCLPKELIDEGLIIE